METVFELLNKFGSLNLGVIGTTEITLVRLLGFVVIIVIVWWFSLLLERALRKVAK